MRSIPSWLKALFGLGAVIACTVDLDDRPGRTCNEQQPCREPRVCVAGRCYGPGETDPRSDGGTRDGGAGGSATGGGSAGGTQTMAGGTSGGGVAAGGRAGGGMGGGMGGGVMNGPAPIWRQPNDGFDPTPTLDMGCTVMVDAANGNQANCASMAGADSQDSASADVKDATKLPTTFEGAVKGKLILTARPTAQGNIPFCELSYTQSMNIHLQLAITPQGELQVSNQAATVSDNAVSNTYAVPGNFGAGTYTFEVRWKRGGMRQVWVNGSMVGMAALAASGNPPANTPDRFRLGIMRVDGPDTGPGANLAVRAWQLGDRENSTLGDLQ